VLAVAEADDLVAIDGRPEIEVRSRRVPGKDRVAPLACSGRDAIDTERGAIDAEDRVRWVKGSICSISPDTGHPGRVANANPRV
jgi:hypothetical protein